MTVHAVALVALWVVKAVAVLVIVWAVRDLIRDPGRPRRSRS